MQSICTIIVAKVLALKINVNSLSHTPSVRSTESVLSALPKSLGKRNVIEAFDRSYPQGNLMTKLAKYTDLARWAILAYRGLSPHEFMPMLGVHNSGAAD